ncbi:MAG: exopolyphosphatase [Desulfobacterales bacterium RIFOXYA12_FULL_46_15]|nr:MAG: exopolyphosphatase [Desulfobacterales bacterium RIFOXYA12_FULL_46_15]
MKDELIIANCSGFYGDRLSAAKELVEGGKIDVLTGDYLAELTMALLFRMKQKDPDKGYVSTFLLQMEQVMGTCLDKGIKIVANAGGLNPQGLAKELKALGRTLGLNPVIAYIHGDDLMPVLSDLQESGEAFRHMDKHTDLKSSGLHPLTANAYLGGFGIKKALDLGADIVVGGRIADAALAAGPSAWKFNWKESDFDKLAGAYTAGHIIECGTQATGGNYSFMDEIPSYENMGFPMARMREDGSFVITKHKGTGGLISKGTVTAQLLYEIREPAYLTPDVKARFDTLSIEDLGDDQVLISGVKGDPPAGYTKVCINTLYGFKNSMTVILTGLDIEKKAEIVEHIVFGIMGGKNRFEKSDVQLTRSGSPNPITNDEAFSYLRISVMDKDKTKVGKLFSSAIVEAALSTIPGFTLTGPPSGEIPAILHWPALVSLKNIRQEVVLNDEVYAVETQFFPPLATPVENIRSEAGAKPSMPAGKPHAGPFTKIALGRLFATRSGDKGGNANLGVWARDEKGFSFLNEFLTVTTLKELLPDMAGFDIERYELPNLLALNFYIKGVLEDGVAASLRSDPQAKTLGEYLRVKIIEIPESLKP